MHITNYNIFTDNSDIKLNIAVCSDLHSRSYKQVLNAFRNIRPDIILLAGDIAEVSNEYMRKRNKNILGFFKAAADIAPCYYCFGNHEIYYSHTKRVLDRIPDQNMLREFVSAVTDMGIHIINDRYEEFKISNGATINIGGLVCGRDMDPDLNIKEPDVDFLNKYDTVKGFKILLCHYPHYYEKYIKSRSFDLTVSGHAHGGQWRFFGRGVYAPHQGLFPKYTSGIYDNKFIISRGASNPSLPIPRIFNSKEILKINIS